MSQAAKEPQQDGIQKIQKKKKKCKKKEEEKKISKKKEIQKKKRRRKVFIFQSSFLPKLSATFQFFCKCHFQKNF